MTSIIVHRAGPGVSLQDGGRRGYLRFGVTHAGPMDAVAHALANLAVGNDRNATAIEVSLGGLEISTANAAIDIAVAGGTFTVTRDGMPLPAACRFTLKPGERLKIAAGGSGSWCYVAVAAKFDLPDVLGSQATHIRSGFGGLNGRCLAEGDRIGLTSVRSFCVAEGAFTAPWLHRSSETIRVLQGPQSDYFDADEYHSFLQTAWRITPRSDRMAIFVEGRRLRHSQGHDIVSDGVVMGSIQVPGDGVPIVLMADSQSTGGYPKIATVIGADLGALAQTRAGSEIHFAAVSYDEALQARVSLERHLKTPVETEKFVRTEFTAEFLTGVSFTSGMVEASTTASIDADMRHQLGRLTTPERLSLLFDDASYSCCDHGNAVTAEGLIYGQRVFAFAKNSASIGGPIGTGEVEALLRLRERAETDGLPLILLYDGGITEAETANFTVQAFSSLADQRAQATGLEIALVFGPCVETDGVLASLADILLTADGGSGVSLAGPTLIQRITNEVVSLAELSFKENISSGHFEDEVTAILASRRLISLNADGEPPGHFGDPDHRTSPGLNHMIGGVPYDMHEILRSVADYGDVFELKPLATSSLITAFVRMGGAMCGVVASEPRVNAGLLTTEGMVKMADFVELCARRRIPLLRLLDCPGMLPGTVEAQARSLAACVRLLKLEASLTIPRITIIIGKASGLAGVLMGLSAPAQSRCFCWPQTNPDLFDTGTDRRESTQLCPEPVAPSETRFNIINAVRALTEATK